MPFILIICFTIIMNLVCATPNITTHHPPPGESVVETIRCIEQERRALLELKQGMTDYDGVLASWGMTTNDCCKWRGVGCSNRTGHVIKLQLRGGFGGVINSSLLGLRHLKVLDLSNNNFGEITQSVSSLVNLQYLNLRLSNFNNVSAIPILAHNLGNLSNLQFLDLSGTTLVLIDDLKWLSNLSSLKYLDLTWHDLTKSRDWFNEISPLFPSLVQLKMSACFLPNISYTSSRASPFLDQGTKYFNLSMSRLAVLELSFNKLDSSSIYPWLLSYNFSRSTLVRIDLRSNTLHGPIPEAFGAFTLLEHLDLSTNELEGGIPRSFRNFSHLHSLDLSSNGLHGQLPLVFSNLSGGAQNSLVVLNLGGNRLTGSLPDFTSFSSLEELRVDKNQLNGSFPKHFGQTSKLNILDVSSNQITGLLPDLSAFSDSLREFSLDGNRLTGSLPESIGQLSKLEVLSASGNFFQGTVTETHLTNLSHLLHLDLSFNNLSSEFNSDWIPPFRLNSLKLSSFKVGPSLPEWIRTQKSLQSLDISNAGISGVIPDWIWELTHNLNYLDLSSNQIEGVITNLTFMSSKFNLVDDTVPPQQYIDLSSNNFSGKIPDPPSNPLFLDLSNNNFSGPISFLCSLTHPTLSYLDLSNNQLSEKIPDCWTNSRYLTNLNLQNNKLTGTIPESMGSLVYVGMLSLRNNGLTGELPSSLRNCTQLQLLDLGENKLIGEIPEWIGESMSILRVFSLGANGFHGTMPLSLCRLPLLQLLDLSVNKISGTIPGCLKNLSGMGDSGSQQNSTIVNNLEIVTDEVVRLDRFYTFTVKLWWKGTQYNYKNTLRLVRSLDLSSNNFSGQIPDEITSLVGLVALNLSRNNLTGHIPLNIGDLASLDFLDLSRNQLGGRIPASLGHISKLSVLDVSYNKLSGQIPIGTQLQSFNASVYMGNLALCGLPLPNECPGSGREAPQPNNRVSDTDDEDQFITRGFYISLVLGFGFGFWGVCGTLLLRSSWMRFLPFEARL